MHEINSLRRANADLTARVAAVQDEAAKSAFQSQQRVNQLQNQNFDLEQEIKQLQSQYKHAIKQEVTALDQKDVQHLAQLLLEKEALIEKLSGDAEEQKAFIYSLRAQLDCQKDAGVAVKQSMYNANDKLEKLTKKFDNLKKRFDTQGRALKKLKSQGTQPLSKSKAEQSKPKKVSIMPGKPSNTSHMYQGSYANPTTVDEEEDDEEEVPLSQVMKKKLKLEAMDIDDDMPLKQRMGIKREKTASQSFRMGAKAKLAPEIIEID